MTFAHSVPSMMQEILDAIQGSIAQDLLWPKRMVLPQSGAPALAPAPVLDRAALQGLAADDPLLRAEQALEALPAVSALAKDRKPAKGLKEMMEVLVGQN